MPFTWKSKIPRHQIDKCIIASIPFFCRLRHFSVFLLFFWSLLIVIGVLRNTVSWKSNSSVLSFKSVPHTEMTTKCQNRRQPSTVPASDPSCHLPQALAASEYGVFIILPFVLCWPWPDLGSQAGDISSLFVRVPQLLKQWWTHSGCFINVWVNEWKTPYNLKNVNWVKCE